MSKKLTIYVLLVLASFLFFIPSTRAVCQVICPIVVGGTLTLLEKYGVDNVISGLWIGGILVWASIVTIDWVAVKWKRHWSISTLIVVAYYLASLYPLIAKDIIGDPHKTLWGADKTVLGVTLGSIFFYLGDQLYIYIKAKNDGRAWFPFQKALMPVLPLIILSTIFYFITR